MGVGVMDNNTDIGNDGLIDGEGLTLTASLDEFMDVTTEVYPELFTGLITISSLVDKVGEKLGAPLVEGEGFLQYLARLITLIRSKSPTPSPSLESEQYSLDAGDIMETQA